MATSKLLLAICCITLVSCETSKTNLDVASTIVELNKMLDDQADLLQQQQTTIDTLGKKIIALEGQLNIKYQTDIC